ncbi:unnamed protein product [Lota lota]
MSNRDSLGFGDLIPQDVAEVFAQERMSKGGRRKKRSKSLGRAIDWFKGKKRKDAAANGQSLGLGPGLDLALEGLSAGPQAGQKTGKQAGKQGHSPGSSPATRQAEEDKTPAPPGIQENVFIETSRPKYMEDLHNEAQEGLKLLQQEGTLPPARSNTPPDSSTVTTQQEEDGQGFLSDSTMADTSSIVSTQSTVSSMSSRSGITRQGSSFRPLNSGKKPEKAKHRRKSRRTVMGIPQHVQKELGLDRMDWNSNPVLDEDLDENMNSEAASDTEASVGLHDAEVHRALTKSQTLQTSNAHASHSDDMAFLHRLGSEMSHRPRSLAVPWLTTANNGPHGPPSPVMSMHPHAAYMSKIIPNAVMPPSVEVLEIQRGRSRNSHKTVSKSSLLVASPSSSRASSRASSCRAPFSRDCSSRASSMSSASQHRANYTSDSSGWSRSESSETLVSDSSTISSSTTPQQQSSADERRAARNSSLPADKVSVHSSVSRVSKATSNGKTEGLARSLSIMKSKRAPPPPSRSYSLHNKMKRRSRDLTETIGTSKESSPQNSSLFPGSSSATNPTKSSDPQPGSKVETDSASPSVRVLRELFNIPPPPKVHAPPPPPPEVWAHNKRTFELLLGPPAPYDTYAAVKRNPKDRRQQRPSPSISVKNASTDTAHKPTSMTQVNTSVETQSAGTSMFVCPSPSLPAHHPTTQPAVSPPMESLWPPPPPPMDPAIETLLIKQDGTDFPLPPPPLLSEEGLVVLDNVPPALKLTPPKSIPPPPETQATVSAPESVPPTPPTVQNILPTPGEAALYTDKSHQAAPVLPAPTLVMNPISMPLEAPPMATEHAPEPGVTHSLPSPPINPTPILTLITKPQEAPPMATEHAPEPEVTHSLPSPSPPQAPTDSSQQRCKETKENQSKEQKAAVAEVSTSVVTTVHQPSVNLPSVNKSPEPNRALDLVQPDVVIEAQQPMSQGAPEPQTVVPKQAPSQPMNISKTPELVQTDVVIDAHSLTSPPPLQTPADSSHQHCKETLEDQRKEQNATVDASNSPDPKQPQEQVLEYVVVEAQQPISQDALESDAVVSKQAPSQPVNIGKAQDLLQPDVVIEAQQPISQDVPDTVVSEQAPTQPVNIPSPSAPAPQVPSNTTQPGTTEGKTMDSISPPAQEEGTTSSVTPSLVQPVKLESMDSSPEATNDQGTQDQSAVTMRIRQPENQVQTQSSSGEAPQKPIRRSLIMSSLPSISPPIVVDSPETVPKSQSAEVMHTISAVPPSPTKRSPPAMTNSPSMNMQEAIRLRTAARAKSPTSPRGPPSPYGGDIHKSPSSVASFIFSKNTRKMGTAPLPEAQPRLQKNRAAELSTVSKPVKEDDLEENKQGVKVPPPVAKKPKAQAKDTGTNVETE